MGLDDVVKGLEKRYGIKIGHLDDMKALQVPYFPTGFMQLDSILGIGGIPLGFFLEVYAPEGVGKTTLCLQLVARAQELGYTAAYIDMEHRLDPEWAATLGVDFSKMYFAQPPYGEAALNIARSFVDGGVSLTIIDSVPALVPKKELEGDTGDQFVGLQPRMLAQNMRQMVHSMRENASTVVFINQIRSKIGGGSLAFGPQQTTPGGWALKHNASIRIDMRRIKAIQSNNEQTGQVVRFSIKKNSLGKPYGQTELVLKFGVGFDRLEELIDLGLEHSIIGQAGSWYTYRDEKIQGRDNLYQFLSDNKEETDLLYDMLKDIIYGGEEVKV